MKQTTNITKQKQTHNAENKLMVPEGKDLGDGCNRWRGLRGTHYQSEKKSQGGKFQFQ